METVTQNRRVRELALNEGHIAYLENRGLSPDIIEQRGYYSVDSSRHLPTLEDGIWSKDVAEKVDSDNNSALVIPLHRAGVSTPSSFQMRLDEPREELVITSSRRDPRYKSIKFEIPAMAERGVLEGNIPADVHPSVTSDVINDPETVIVITEGIVKADAILSAARAHNLPIVPVALTGVTMGYHRPESTGNRSNRYILTPDLAALPLAGRQVVLVWDADANSNTAVASALVKTGDLLAEAGATVEALVVPRVDGDSKSGIDDWLARHSSRDEFVRLFEQGEDLERLRLVGKSYEPDDTGRGQRLADELLRRNRHRLVPHTIAGQGKWFEFDGVKLSEEGAANSVTRIAAELSRRDPRSANTGSTAAIRAVIHSAATNPSLAIREDDLDADLGVLATCAGQLIDLRTGTVRPTQIDDFITRTTAVPYDPELATPEFDRFLEDITLGDNELQEFLQGMFGMILLGNVIEEKMFFLNGTGANGKTALMRIFSGILGTDLVKNIRGDELSELKNDTLADLDRRRLALATDAMKRDLSAEVIKSLASKDKVAGRNLWQSAKSFDPSHTTVVYTNTLPRLSHLESAVWRRVVVVPFLFEVQNPDAELDSRILKNEGAGVLAWGVEGARKFVERGGLPPSEAVEKAIHVFEDKEDILRSWLRQYCVLGTDHREPMSDVKKHLDEFTRIEYGFVREMSTQKLMKELNAMRGVSIGKERTSRAWLWTGIALRADAWDALETLEASQ